MVDRINRHLDSIIQNSGMSEDEIEAKTKQMKGKSTEELLTIVSDAGMLHLIGYALEDQITED